MTLKARTISTAAAFALVASSLSFVAPVQAQTSGIGGLFACGASGNKQVGGALIGAAAGGLIGNQVAKNERTLGTIVGAAAGAALGQYIGCKMQESDQRKAEAATLAALQNNRPTNWSNPDTGASGQVNVSPYQGPYGSSSESYQSTSLGGIRLASNVEPASSYTPAAAQYRARSNVNLRAGPTTNARVVGQVRAGDVVDVLAATRPSRTDWLLISRNGVGQGYVMASYFNALGSTQVAGGGTAQNCKSVDQTVRVSDGTTQTQKYIACQQPNGEWTFRDA